MLADDLRAAFLTGSLTEQQLAALLDVGEERAFATGDELFEEGIPAELLWILLDGTIELSRRSGTQQVTVGTMATPGQWAGGLTAWAPDALDTGYRASGRASSDGRAFVVPSAELGRLVGSWLPFAKHLITGVYGTIRSIDSTARELSRLASLGEHAARLAHELNNPAAASLRAVEGLARACDAMPGALAVLVDGSVGADALTELDGLRRRLRNGGVDAGAIATMDREDAVGDWLAARDTGSAWDLAAVLVGAGADVEWLVAVESVVGRAQVGAALQWVATTVEADRLLAELSDATGRIARLVDDARSYTQMDRAPLQSIDVHEGIESTLRMLRPKLSGIEIERDLDGDLPDVDAFASELNQVWTNVIDNAVDAMDGRGTLRLSSRRDGDAVVVEVSDSGPGIPPEILTRVFEPFFTTKDVGRGTGLGLDIARRIVVARHGGEISLTSEPGATTVRVRLPIRHP